MRYILSMQKNDLSRLRRKIDAVDKAILASLGKRKKLEYAIGAYKKEHGIKLLDVARRDTMVKIRITEGKKKGVQPELVRKLFKLIHRHSLALRK
jgi:chorismate mutase